MTSDGEADDGLVDRIDHAEEALDGAFLGTAKLCLYLNSGAVPAAAAMLSLAGGRPTYIDAALCALSFFLVGILIASRVSEADLILQESRAQDLRDELEGRKAQPHSHGDGSPSKAELKRELRFLRIVVRRPRMQPYTEENLKIAWARQKKRVRLSLRFFWLGVLFTVVAFGVSQLPFSDSDAGPRFLAKDLYAEYISDSRHQGGAWPRQPCGRNDNGELAVALVVTVLDDGYFIDAGPAFKDKRGNPFRRRHLGAGMDQGQLDVLLDQVARDASGAGCRPALWIHRAIPSFGDRLEDLRPETFSHYIGHAHALYESTVRKPTPP
ncbi:hypothetical protein C882_3004 [Caenispirillum salinarum AK4]|uniref:Uncharacterized protein n=1 Tax=Caenispirillum salinarum AK4 TaxID=1238182 RepID=K9H0Y2_9PROT|nr:hypothetical protein [Caenispirillum salinarum]EKV31940.1 hypothetical protein C882_3004 [Caenispirillum salinarum AK4]